MHRVIITVIIIIINIYLFGGKSRVIILEIKKVVLINNAHVFISGYMASDMIKDYTDSEKGNPLPPLHGILFLMQEILHHPTNRTVPTQHAICDTSCRTLAGTINSSMGVAWRIDPNETCFSGTGFLKRELLVLNGKIIHFNAIIALSFNCYSA